MKKNSLSFYLSVGCNRGLKIQKDGPSIRLNLWILSFCFGFFDIEKTMHALLEEAKHNDNDRESMLHKLDDLNTQITFLKATNESSEQINTELRKNIDNEESKKQHEEEVESLQAQISDLSDEIDRYEEIDSENEDLKNKISELHRKTNALNFEIEYIKRYFDLM